MFLIMILLSSLDLLPQTPNYKQLTLHESLALGSPHNHYGLHITQPIGNKTFHYIIYHLKEI